MKSCWCVARIPIILAVDVSIFTPWGPLFGVRGLVESYPVIETTDLLPLGLLSGAPYACALTDMARSFGAFLVE